MNAVWPLQCARCVSKTYVPRFKKVPNDIAVTYIDDTIVSAKNLEEGLENLRKVFGALRAANLTLRLDKCHFFKRSVDYL